MTEHGAKVRLPETALGAERNFMIDFSFHGDMQLAFWDGELGSEDDQPSANFKVFELMHGAELPLIGAFIGYYRRLKLPEAQIAQDFTQAGQDILSENLPPSYDRFMIDGASSYALGRLRPRLDIPELDWQCLMHVRPRQPGLAEEVGGTALYTTPHPIGKLALVFARVMPGLLREGHLGADIEDSAMVLQEDIPVMAGMICYTSMGDYRRGLATFLRQEFMPSDQNE